MIGYDETRPAARTLPAMQAAGRKQVDDADGRGRALLMRLEKVDATAAAARIMPLENAARVGARLDGLRMGHISRHAPRGRDQGPETAHLRAERPAWKMFAFDAAMRESYVEYALTPGAAANVCDLLRDQTAFLKRTTPTELASYAERARKKLV